ncbi:MULTISPECIES: hypothetical protein [unclassified Microcoleus]|uniref:hypothetical protein n=1 Tax=unclassified Microcoleus TaxID=2642155 RepID=UPI002FCEE2A0
MNLTSTLLKIDLAVLSVVLAVLLVLVNAIRSMQKEAVDAAKQRAEVVATIKFHDQRLTNVENFIAGNSGFKSQ